MNALFASAMAGFALAAWLIVINFAFKALLAFRGFGSTPAGAGLAAVIA